MTRVRHTWSPQLDLRTMIAAELLEILVCPACKSKVEPRDVRVGDKNEARLVCTNAGCGLRFPVRDDIPVMLIEEADKAT